MTSQKIYIYCPSSDFQCFQGGSFAKDVIVKSLCPGSHCSFFEQHVAFGASEAGVGMYTVMSQVRRQADCHSLGILG